MFLGVCVYLCLKVSNFVLHEKRRVFLFKVNLECAKVPVYRGFGMHECSFSPDYTFCDMGEGKDWTGNGKSIFMTLGASNHTDKEREKDDFYATDPVAIDGLLNFFHHELHENIVDDGSKIWECACGNGCLSERLKQYGYVVVSTDIVDRGYERVMDFLSTDSVPGGCTCILTNPPYRYALEFVEHAIDILPNGGLCMMFLKTTFLEGQKRHDRLFSVTPPKYVLQFSKRVLCAKNGEFDRMRKGGGSAVAYAWFVWKKGDYNLTEVRWI